MRHRQRTSTPGVNYGLLKEASVKFVGWDWASTSHDVTVLDDQGRVIWVVSSAIWACSCRRRLSRWRAIWARVQGSSASSQRARSTVAGWASDGRRRW
jgi:hypothetical protein